MTTQGYARPELLVETDWLEAHLNDPDIRIVGLRQLRPVRPRPHRQRRGHPGAQLHQETQLPQRPHRLPPGGVGGGLCPAHGQNGHQQRHDGGVLRRRRRPHAAARLWWVLNYYGHTKAKMLNGGWKKWHDEGRPTSTDAVRPPEDVLRPPPRTRTWSACWDYGVSCVGDTDTVFLDVRSDDEWTGAGARGNRRAGHIPGAVHLEWLNFVTSDKYQTVKPAAELRAMLEERGVTPDKQIITY